MSKTISEGEIVIKDELPQVEPIKALQVPVKIEEIEETEKETKLPNVVVKIVDNKLERFVISTLDDEESEEVQTKIYPCDKCDRSFKFENNLKRHQLNHEEHATYSCRICGKEFKTPHYLFQHSFIHRKTRDFQCDQCEKSFKTASNLTQHKYGHVEEKAFACSICCKAFKKKAVMRRHELGHSKKEEDDWY